MKYLKILLMISLCILVVVFLNIDIVFCEEKQDEEEWYDSYFWVYIYFISVFTGFGIIMLIYHIWRLIKLFIII